MGWGGSAQNSHAAQGLGSALVKVFRQEARLVNNNFEDNKEDEKKTKRHTTTKNPKKKKHCK